LLQTDGVQAGWDMNAFPSPHCNYVTQSPTKNATFSFLLSYPCLC